MNVPGILLFSYNENIFLFFDQILLFSSLHKKNLLLYVENLNVSMMI
ncbi:hypothetical protein CHCC20335_0444 [Bacillus paralicheniformis]|nr:hypothetical protein CHCC20335_0444 [Bacillus paralicheniformis]